jgi:hypothetical protein
MIQVHAEERTYEPDRVVKHERYVLMIWPDEKVSIPWERIKEVNEPLCLD